MRTTIFGTIIAVFTAVLLTSCSQGKSGGPGAKPPEKPASTSSSVMPLSQAKDTFSLDVPDLATSLKRGEAKATSITVKRGANMTQDITLTFDGLPNGVTIDPKSVSVPGSQNDGKFTVKASNEAPVGNFKVKVIGHPATGPDATNDFKVTVSEQ